MTDLLSRPILRVSTAATAPDRPVALAAAVGGAAVAAGGVICCLALGAAGWFAADTGSFGTAMAVALLGWLVGNGSGLTGGGVSVGMIPLGFVLACGFALFRLGRWAATTSRVRSARDLALGGLVMVLSYGAPGVIAASAVRVQGTHAPLPRAVAAFVLVPLVFGGLGLLFGSGLAKPLLQRLPEEVRAALFGGLVGALVLVTLSAVALLLSLGAHYATALRLADGLHAGLVGGLIFTVVGVALVPNAVLCAGAFLAGPGFALGTGTQVAPNNIRLGLLPDFPLLAAVPTSTAAWWLPVLMLAPVGAGAFAGVLSVRRFPVARLDRGAIRGALAGLTGAVAFGLLTGLATGSAGPGRLRHLGPDVLGTTAVCIVAFMLGGTVAAIGARLLGGEWLSRGSAALRGRVPSFPLRRRMRPESSGDESADLAPASAGAPDEETTQPIPTAPQTD